MVLGGGTGGTIAANRLRRALGADVAITVVDQDDDHVYQPGLLFVPFGMADAADLVRPRSYQLRDGVAFHAAAVDRVDVDGSRVFLDAGLAHQPSHPLAVDRQVQSERQLGMHPRPAVGAAGLGMNCSA